MVSDLYIPFKDFASTGGVTRFMDNLKTALDRKGYKYSQNPKDIKNIFFPVEYDIDILDSIKDKSGKIIQRLDGVFYPGLHSEAQLEFDKKIKKIYNQYSDFVIFQSEYSKEQCFHNYGKKEKDKYKVIINGVDKGVFRLKKNKKRSNDEITFVTTGNFRRADMLQPIIRALDLLSNKYKFKLIVIGPVMEEFRNIIDRGYIKSVGDKPMKEVAKYLQKSDLFLYSFINAPCPNSVIEAISIGLPVVGFDSGSMKELLYFATDLLAEVSDDLFQRVEQLNHIKLAEKIEFAIRNLEKISERAVLNSSLYSFADCVDEYVEVFETVLI